MKVALCFSLTALVTLTGGPALAQSSKEKPLTVRLGPQNKSGESGTARLTPQGSETRVEIALKGAPKGVTQPAHIHEGTCAKLDPKPKQGLENVVDGKSSTVVPMRLDDLLKGVLHLGDGVLEASAGVLDDDQVHRLPS